jgi:hypothetical protein
VCDDLALDMNIVCSRDLSEHVLLGSKTVNGREKQRNTEQSLFFHLCMSGTYAFIGLARVFMEENHP